jgi:hypothetical protein
MSTVASVLSSVIEALKAEGATLSGLDGCASTTYYQALQAGFKGHMSDWKDQVVSEIERLKEAVEENSVPEGSQQLTSEDVYPDLAS